MVVPAFMEGSAVSHAIRRILNEIDSQFEKLKIVVVLDGPDRQSRNALGQLIDGRVEVRELQSNQGKGAAIREGCKGVDTHYVGFLDADLDIHPISLIRCVETLHNAQESSIVGAYGSKFHPESEVSYPPIRRIGSKIFKELVRVMFKVDCEDTQTGVKAFRFSQVSDVLLKTRENRFLFDVEFLADLADHGLKVASAPVRLDYQYSSSIDVSQVTQMCADLLALKFRRSRPLSKRHG